MEHQVIVIDTVTIKQDKEGRFCLNDLHKAAGGSPKDQPAHWWLLDKTKELVLELRGEWENSRKPEIICPNVSIKGRNGGTYVVKELVYAYAMWICKRRREMGPFSGGVR